MKKRIDQYYNSFCKYLNQSLRKTTYTIAFKEAIYSLEREFVLHERINPYIKNGNGKMLKTLTRIRYELAMLNRKWRGLVCFIAAEELTLHKYNMLRETHSLNFLYGGMRRQLDRYEGLSDVLMDGLGLEAANMTREDIILGFNVVFNWTEEEIYEDFREQINNG